VPFETGRRLCVLLEAGEARYAIEASSVVEVFTPKEGRAPQGLELTDLSAMLDGTPEPAPGAGVVLDVSPTLALGIKRVVEIADVARSPFHQLPAWVGSRLSLFVRGAVEHAGKLYLELSPELFGQRSGPLPPPPARPILMLEELPPRALLVESGGQRFGIPLPWVSQVVPREPGACALPGRGAAVAIQVHGQALWPIFSTPALIGGAPTPEPLLVLTELAGQNVALTARAALGVHGPFEAADSPGEHRPQGGGPSALFLDLQRMFS
jgi:hypothetical protein